MYQIDVSTATQSRPGSTPQGTPGWYTDGNPAGGNPATIVPAEWLNMVQDELINVLRAAAIAPSKSQFNQIALALQFGLAALGVDSGSANSYVITLASAPAALSDGIAVTFRAHAANTGASTLNLNGLGAQPLLGTGQQALQGSEIALGGFVRVVWSANLSAWVITDNTGGSQQVANASQSRHAVNLGQIQAGIGRYAVDTGSGNAYVVALNPAPATPTDGFTFSFLATHANTGAATLALNGAAAFPLWSMTHAALQSGEIINTSECRVVWSVALNGWVLAENTGGTQPVVTATQSRHAVPLAQMQASLQAQAGGRWLNTQLFAGSGTYNPTAGTTKIRIRAIAGGGGGAGAAATAAGQVSVSTGGTSGMYAECWITNPVATAVTIGGAGTAGGGGGGGGAGGNTSFGGALVLLGGTGGYPGPPTVPPTVGTAPPPPTGGTFPGTTAVAFRGAAGAPGEGMNLNSTQGGAGGQSPIGGSVPGGSPGGGNAGAGRNAQDNGSGGAGGSVSQGYAATTGGYGGGGFMIIEEYS